MSDTNPPRPGFLTRLGKFLPIFASRLSTDIVEVEAGLETAEATEAAVDHELEAFNRALEPAPSPSTTTIPATPSEKS